ncbi:hypothetical protein GCM10010405_43760 [Streptomyces macrosporus]|uniref:Transposase n=1 Tax=Streptomyces macrosporus TaxID=44032 RepID=A0ABP5XHL0_9ACTN
MLAAALEAEVEQYTVELAAERDEAGRRLVVRDGRHRERTAGTAAGPVAVRAPRVNDKRVDEATGDGCGSRRRSPPAFGREVPPATVVPEVAEDQRGAAPALSARLVQW